MIGRERNRENERERERERCNGGVKVKKKDLVLFLKASFSALCVQSFWEGRSCSSRQWGEGEV